MPFKKTEKTTEVSDTSIINNLEKEIAPLKKEVVKRKYTPQEALAEHTFVDNSNGQPLFVNKREVYKKLCLTKEESSEIIGGADPALYFRDGLIHQSFIKTFGNILPETDEETITMREVIPFKDVLLFKQKRQNAYVMLIPKNLSEYEVGYDGEFTNETVNYDIRVITFTGSIAYSPAGSPSAYEESYFRQHLQRVADKLSKVYETKRIASRK
jgi:hypothetical protein